MRSTVKCILQFFLVFIAVLVSLSASMTLLVHLRKTVVNYTSFIDLYLYNIFSREVTFSRFVEFLAR